MTEHGFGVRSMVAPLRRALVVTPTTAGDFAAAGWRAPDGPALLAEHATFCDLLERLGVELVRVQAPPGLVDAVYAYDSVFVAGSGAVVLRAAKPARAAEAAWLAPLVEAAGVPVLGALEEPATADGGDLMWLEDGVLALGRGHRTNAHGHVQVADLLRDDGVRLRHRFDLPWYLGPDAVLHLMSVVSLVSDRVAVVHRPLAPVGLVERLLERGVTLVDVDEAEFGTQGGNVLAVRPGVAVLPAGNPRVQAALEALDVEVHTYVATELNKGDGGPTCLTRPLWRAY